MYVHLERQKLAKIQKNVVAELKELSKLKDEFLSVCSHDLRSPLNGIMGFTDIMLREEKTIPGTETHA